MGKGKKVWAAFLTVMLVLAMGMTVLAASKPKISKKSAKLTYGQSVTLKVSGTRGRIRWKSSNKKVAAVNGSGVVTAKGVGRATITAKAGSKKLSCKITVRVKSLKISMKSLTLSPKKSYRLVAVADGRPVTVKWKVSNKKVVTVNKKGVVKAKKQGNAVIIASFGGKKAKCTIRVRKNAPTTGQKNPGAMVVVPAAPAVSVNVSAPVSQPVQSATTPTVPVTPAAPVQDNGSSTGSIPSGSGSTGTVTNNPGTSGSSGQGGSGSGTGNTKIGYTDEEFNAYLQSIKASSEIPDYSKLTDLQKRKAYDFILARKCGFFAPGVSNWQRIANLMVWMENHIPYSAVGTYYSRYTRDDSIAPGYDLAKLLKERYPNDHEFANPGYDCIWAAQMVVDYAHYFLHLEASRYLAPLGTSGTHQNAAVYLPAESGRPAGWYSCIPGFIDENHGGQHISNTPLTAECENTLWYNNLMKAIKDNPSDRYMLPDSYSSDTYMGYDYEKGLTK